MNPQTKECWRTLAMRLLRDGQRGEDRYAQMPRQPGSSFKPFVYAAAFQQGYSPATVVFDVPTKFGTDTPQNFDGNYWGS